MTSDTAPTPPTGPAARLGKYELLGQLAQGGMAEIHLARAQGIEGFEKLVVVKKILPNLANNREFVQMFLDEARIAASLHHSNIAQVYEIGEEGGSYYFVMEFLHGEDMSRIMRASRIVGRMPPLEHVLFIMSSLCAGLHYAHDKTSLEGEALGIVHRDISPQNVFVTYDGGVKIVDFGIAKAAHRATATRVGTLKGKLRYMSPEQARQEPLDRRSDIFAVGVMLWEMTTGKRLFYGPNDFEILRKIIDHHVPLPSTVVPRYASELEHIVMKALAADRDERYSTAQELQEDIENFVRNERLGASSLGLQRFMKSLFGQRLEAYAVARSSGLETLARHLAVVEHTEQVSQTLGTSRNSFPQEKSKSKTMPPVPPPTSSSSVNTTTSVDFDVVSSSREISVGTQLSQTGAITDADAKKKTMFRLAVIGGATLTVVLGLIVAFLLTRSKPTDTTAVTVPAASAQPKENVVPPPAPEEKPMEAQKPPPTVEPAAAPVSPTENFDPVVIPHDERKPVSVDRKKKPAKPGKKNQLDLFLPR